MSLEKPQKNKQENSTEKRERLYNDLQKMGELLSQTGLTLWPGLADKSVFNKIWDKEFGPGGLDLGISSLPLVMDGANGIRVNLGRRDENWTIFFTNGFEDPDNPKRQEVTKLLRENGFNAI